MLLISFFVSKRLKISRRTPPKPATASNKHKGKQKTQRRESFEVHLIRSMQHTAAVPKLGPTFCLLDSEDLHNTRIGYIDMTRLMYQDVDTAMDAVKNSSSLILDLRGYAKGTIYRYCCYGCFAGAM